MSIPTVKPRYHHDSKMDLFLGVYKSVDIYANFSEYSSDQKGFPEGYYGNMIRYRNFDYRQSHSYDHLPQILLYILMKLEDEPCSINSETIRLLNERNLIFQPPSRTDHDHCVLLLRKEQIFEELESRKLRKFTVEVTKQRTWTETKVVIAETPTEVVELAEVEHEVINTGTPELVPYQVSDIFDIYELQPT